MSQNKDTPWGLFKVMQNGDKYKNDFCESTIDSTDSFTVRVLLSASHAQITKC